MDLLTKVAKGTAYGDVSNAAIRNILAEISRKVFGAVTEQDMQDALDYFDGKCPYTGRNIQDAIDGKLGGYATDHIVPQNKEHCGLNVKGNLIIVDKQANAEKRDKTIEEFFNNPNSKVLAGVDEKTRKERLAKIKQFQCDSGYDPEKLKPILSRLLEKWYNDLRKKQESIIKDLISALGMQPLVPSSGKSAGKKGSTLPSIVYFVSGGESTAEDFKEALLKAKRAEFKLTYASGAVKTSPWKAEQFDSNSDLIANIRSRPFWRKRISEGLEKVEVVID